MKMAGKYRELLLLLIAIALIAVFTVAHPFEGLTRSGMTLLGIFIATVFLWISVGISWPSLFGLLVLALLLPEISMTSLISSSVGNTAFSFLIFTFCISHALNQTQFTRRCAIWFLSTKLARKGPWTFLGLYFLSILLLGSCMSTTVLVMIYLTINEEFFSLMGLKKGDKFAALMTIGLIITASISGAMTPIAHVFPLTALGIYNTLTGQSISYIAYMAAGVPAALLSVAAMLLLFRFIMRPDTSAIQDIRTDSMKDNLAPVDRREMITVAVFLMVVALWVLPDLVGQLIPAIGYIGSFGTVLPPLLGCIILCVIRLDDKPIMDLGEATRNVPWPSLLMAASALAIGAAITNGDIGLSDWISSRMEPLASSLDGISLMVLLVAITGIFTNVGSNMVAVSIMCTVGIPIALSLGGTVHAGALAVVLGMMSSYAFATPPAMTTVVLGTGSGWTTTKQMAVYGFMILLPCIVFVAFIAYPIARALL